MSGERVAASTQIPEGPLVFIMEDRLCQFSVRAAYGWLGFHITHESFSRCKWLVVMTEMIAQSVQHIQTPRRGRANIDCLDVYFIIYHLVTHM